MKNHVSIIGYGEIGSALAHVLSKKSDITIEQWDKNVDIVPKQKSLSVIIPASSIIFICVPTWSARGALQTIAPLLAPNTIVVTLCKGFEKETCMNVHELFTRNLPSTTPLVFLGGPMIAEELLANMETLALVASTNSSARQTITDLFHGTILATQQTEDIIGAIMSGALENVYALGLGIGDALGIGSNAHGVLVAVAVKEMTQIVIKHGGKMETALGLSGIGDLVATAQSANSTNYTTGIRSAQGLPALHGSEALNTIACIAPKLIGELQKFPFLSAIHEIVVNGKNAKEAMDKII